MIHILERDYCNILDDRRVDCELDINGTRSCGCGKCLGDSISLALSIKEFFSCLLVHQSTCYGVLFACNEVLIRYRVNELCRLVISRNVFLGRIVDESRTDLGDIYSLFLVVNVSVRSDLNILVSYRLISDDGYTGKQGRVNCELNCYRSVRLCRSKLLCSSNAQRSAGGLIVKLTGYCVLLTRNEICVLDRVNDDLGGLISDHLIACCLVNVCSTDLGDFDSLVFIIDIRMDSNFRSVISDLLESNRRYALDYCRVDCELDVNRTGRSCRCEVLCSRDAQRLTCLLVHQLAGQCISLARKEIGIRYCVNEFCRCGIRSDMLTRCRISKSRLQIRNINSLVSIADVFVLCYDRTCRRRFVQSLVSDQRYILDDSRIKSISYLDCT